jgi:hypothetical protein
MPLHRENVKVLHVDAHDRVPLTQRGATWVEAEWVRQAWRSRAPALAQWAWDRLANRRDCWGAYTPVERRGQVYQRKDGTEGVMPVSCTSKGTLTLGILRRHFCGRRHEHIVGLHSSSTDNQCRWAALDIDAHGPDGNDPAANLRAALARYDRLVALGFRPLLYASNAPPRYGRFHLLAIFDEPVPTVRVFSFLQWLVSAQGQYGVVVETFPKQRFVPEGGYGSWLRLVGRHHSRDFWPSVWSGTTWLQGPPAVAHILTITGDDPGLIPPEALPKVQLNVRIIPIHHHHHRGGGAPVDVRVRAYARRLPRLGAGQGRHRVAYGFAAWLLRDLGLGERAALSYLAMWDSTNAVTLGDLELSKIAASAVKYGRRPLARAQGGPRS